MEPLKGYYKAGRALSEVGNAAIVAAEKARIMTLHRLELKHTLHRIKSETQRVLQETQIKNASLHRRIVEKGKDEACEGVSEGTYDDVNSSIVCPCIERTIHLEGSKELLREVNRPASVIDYSLEKEIKLAWNGNCLSCIDEKNGVLVVGNKRSTFLVDTEISTRRKLRFPTSFVTFLDKTRTSHNETGSAMPVILGGIDGSVKTFKPLVGQLEQIYSQDSSITGIKVLRSEFVVSSSAKGVWKLCNLETGNSLAEKKVGESIQFLDLEQDGNLLSTVSNHAKTELWDLRNPQKAIFGFERDSTFSSLFLQRRNRIIVGSEQNIEVVDFRGLCVPEVVRNGDGEAVSCMALDESKNYLACSGSKLSVYSIGQKEQELQPLQDLVLTRHQYVKSVTFNEDATKLFALTRESVLTFSKVRTETS